MSTVWDFLKWSARTLGIVLLILSPTITYIVCHTYFGVKMVTLFYWTFGLIFLALLFICYPGRRRR